MKGTIKEINMIGFNMRMTEMQAAILIEQLKKLKSFVEKRQMNAIVFMNALKKIPFIKPALNRPGATHSFYVQAFYYDQEKAEGVHRDKFIHAVKAELQPEQGRIDKGVPIGCGYIKPIYRMPLFSGGETVYDHRQYPIVEKLWKDELFITTIQGLNLGNFDRKDVIDAFYKVAGSLEELRDGK